MRNAKIQLLEKEVTAANASVTLNEELDRNYSHLTGIAFPTSLGDGATLINSSVDGAELFPKNFEVANLQSSASVAPDQRYLSLGLEAKGKKIEMEFKDGGNAAAYPYTLQVHLKLENRCDD